MITNNQLPNHPVEIAVIGGSGLYNMDELKNTQELTIHTPFGNPSDAILVGEINGVSVAFLSRHGRGHKHIPTEVPYQANIYALKTLGVKYIISVSAVGSLQKELKPLDMVLPDQMIDMTKHRQSTFFGNGCVAHVSMAQPTCTQVSKILAEAYADCDFSGDCHQKGTYVCIEGPQFSSQAESHWYRSMNADIIGMTNMPEAKLAKEASIAYATLALVTDYDCWHPHEEQVSADYAIKNLMQNTENAQLVVKKAIQLIHQQKPESESHTALLSALVTPIEAMNDETKNRLNAILPKN